MPIASLYPVVVLSTAPVLAGVGCNPAPKIQTIQLINDGGQAFADQVGSIYFVSYASNHKDAIGNQSTDGKNWNPPAPNTDPPSHFVLVNRDFPSDCAFYPVFDLFGSLFAMAWLENNPVGRINLKYADSPTSLRPPGGNPPPSEGAPQTIYIYPNVPDMQSHVQTENIALSDLQIVDTSGNMFNLNAFMHDPSYRGYEMTMPQSIKAVRFSQTFREPNTNLNGFLGTAQTPDSPISLPLAGIGITIYYGKTNMVYKRIITDQKGVFAVKMLPQMFTFEIEVSTLSINYAQRFV